MKDLSKALNCFHHELLIVKLDAYVFHLKSMRLIQQIDNRG